MLEKENMVSTIIREAEGNGHCERVSLRRFKMRIKA